MARLCFGGAHLRFGSRLHGSRLPRTGDPPRTKVASDALRVFFAIWPEAAARDALAQRASEIAAETGGRAPAIENLHLTIAFVGEVAGDRLEALSAAGVAATAHVPAFDLSLDRVGAFRGSGIAWAGASSVPAELAQLVGQLNSALTAQGFPTDPRPFQAHVTLARRCRRRFAEKPATPIAWMVAKLTLNASELAPGGPRYRELAAWPLGHRAADDAAT
jgi:RNA 2',3'-cyclic 3'-phosphodiesterase